MDYQWIKLLFPSKTSHTFRFYYILARILYWIAVVAVSVYIAEMLGYPLTPMPFEFESLVLLFSNYYLVFGVVLGALVVYILMVVTNAMILFLQAKFIPPMVNSLNLWNGKSYSQYKIEKHENASKKEVKAIIQQQSKFRKDVLAVNGIVETYTSVIILFTVIQLTIVSSKFPYKFAFLIGCLFFMASLSGLASIAGIRYLADQYTIIVKRLRNELKQRKK